jgi:hypothetical protein
MLPELLRREANAQVVQHVFEVLSSKRSLHGDVEMEYWGHVIAATVELRRQLAPAARESTTTRSCGGNFVRSAGEYATRHLIVMGEDINEIVGRLAREFKVQLPQELQGPNWYSYPE